MSGKKHEFELPLRVPLPAIPPQLSPKRSTRPVKCRTRGITGAQPVGYLNVQVDGRETTYFEWMGAGFYAAERRVSIENSFPHLLHELCYGFDDHLLFLRVDPSPAELPKLRDCEFQILIRGGEELHLTVLIEEGNVAGWLLETDDVSILGPHELARVAFERILEVAIDRRLLPLEGQSTLGLKVTLSMVGVPVDFLPIEGLLEVNLGADAFAFPVR